jgi:hypothetical protein
MNANRERFQRADIEFQDMTGELAGRVGQGRKRVEGWGRCARAKNGVNV